VNHHALHTRTHDIKNKLIAGTDWNINVTEVTGKKESLLLGTVSQKLIHLLEKITGCAITLYIARSKEKQSTSGHGIQESYNCKQ
jgi:hypothetical protein